MDFFKKFLAFSILGMHTLFAFSSQPKEISDNDFLLLGEKSKECQEELERKIEKILDISSVKISKNAFIKDSHLYLTNQKAELFTHKNPMQGYAGSEKIFLLYSKKGELFISLVDHKNKPLNTEILNICQRVNK